MAEKTKCLSPCADGGGLVMCIHTIYSAYACFNSTEKSSDLLYGDRENKLKLASVVC